MVHYRILHRDTGGEPSCSLVEVFYNDDGSIAAAIEPSFCAITPQEILNDLGAALTQAACCPPIRDKDVVGHHDFDDIPF